MIDGEDPASQTGSLLQGKRNAVDNDEHRCPQVSDIVLTHKAEPLQCLLHDRGSSASPLKPTHPLQIHHPKYRKRTAPSDLVTRTRKPQKYLQNHGFRGQNTLQGTE